MFAGSLLFVLGFTVVFVILGTASGALGAWLVTWNRQLAVVLGVLTILLGLAFGGWLPFLNREWRVHQVPSVGLAAARKLDLDPAIPVVTLATAHPAKFRDAVERATGVRPALPSRLGSLFDRQEDYARLPATFEAVTGYIAERAVARD